MNNINTTICYMSNVNSKIYASNTNSKFTSLLDEKLLHYIPKCKKLQVALKSISFASLKSSENLTTAANATTKHVLGLRSNITSEPIFCTLNCDKIFSIFQINDWNKDRITIEIDNPIFYQSTFELIANPQFELIELISNSTLVGIDSIKSVPTVIEITVTSESMHAPPFHMVFMSNDKNSKQIFKENNNVNFSIQLNQRIQFESQWTLVLKSCLMSSHIYNIQTEDFIYTFIYIEKTKGRGKRKKVFVSGYIDCGRYTTKLEIIDHLNKKMKQDKIPITFSVDEDKCGAEYTSDDFEDKSSLLNLAPNLANLLGYSKNAEKAYMIRFSTNLPYYGLHPININYGLPKALLINCALVNKIVVGENLMSTLRLIYLDDSDFKQQVVNFTFRQNTYAVIGTNWFDGIKFSITDLKGNILKAENNHPTILHLLFVNV